MAHADMMLYNVLKVITQDDRLANYLAVNDPKTMAQANAAMSCFEEENAPPEVPEWVVDLYIPFTAVVPAEMADTADEAEAVARDAFIAEDLYQKCVDLMEDTVFGASDSEWRAEVGEG